MVSRFYYILRGNSFRVKGNQKPREDKFCIPVHILDIYCIWQ